MTGKELRTWWAAWRRLGSPSWIALLFDTTPRTVQRWLAAGLAEHELVKGLETAVKEYDHAAGVEVWHIHPLGVVYWHVQRLADGRRDAPFNVKRIGADPKVWSCVWSIASESWPDRYSGERPPFSWSALDALLTMTAAQVTWAADSEGDLDGPFFPSEQDTPDRWIERHRGAADNPVLDEYEDADLEAWAKDADESLTRFEAERVNR